VAFFDTNILIDAALGRPEAFAAIEGCRSHKISIIVWIEVMSGKIVERNLAKTTAFLSLFTCVPIDEAIAARAAQIRRHARMKVNDAIVLATARVHGEKLLTRDIKDFPRNDPEIVVPYGA
jgi:predicted nucleic acid-binding protein